MTRRRLPGVVGLLLLAGCAGQPGAFSSAPPSLHVGQVALANGEPGIAAAVAQTWLSEKPGDLDALLLRGQAYAANGDAAPAVADFRTVLAARPSSTDAALGLSRLLTPTDPAATEGVLAAFVVRGVASAPVWNNLGVAHDLRGRHAEAQHAYRQALATDPAMRGAEANLAHSLSLAPMGPGPAFAVAAAPSPNVFGRLAGWFARLATADEDRLRAAEALLQSDPGNRDYRRDVVRAALRAGARSRASQIASQTVEDAPSDPLGYLMQAAVELDRDHKLAALKLLLTARRLARPAAATG